MVGKTQENEFNYVFDDSFSETEIYAVGYDTYGLPVETNHIFVECTDGVYTVILPDTDGDGLEDVYEIYYGSDVNLVDTDGDKLSDYYEVYVSSTYNEHNYYDVVFHNCAYVAGRAWNVVLNCDRGKLEKLWYDMRVEFTPNSLKRDILSWEGNYELNLRTLLGLE